MKEIVKEQDERRKSEMDALQSQINPHFLYNCFANISSLCKLNEMEKYIQLLIDCIEHLSPEIVIHRLTGDGPKDLLIAPLWSSGKRTVLNRIHAALHERSTWQGRLL